MGFLGYGAAKTMAYQHDYQKDIDRLYQREAYASQVKAETEKKTAYWAELMKEHNPVNPSITSDLEKYYDDLTNQMAELATNNPGWERDVTVMQKMMGISDKFLNNPLVLQDKQGQQEFEKFKEAAAKGDLTQMQIDEEMKRYKAWQDNYKGTDEDGNEMGPYVYSNPKPYGMVEAVSEVSSVVDTFTSSTIGEDGNVITSISIPDLYSLARTTYAENDNIRHAVDRAWDQVEKSGNKPLYKSKMDMWMQFIKNSQKLGYSDSELSDYMKAQISNQGDLFDYVPHFDLDIANNYIQYGRVDASDRNLIFTEFNGQKGVLNMGAGGRRVAVRPEGGNELVPFEIKGNVVALNGGEIFSAIPNDKTGSAAFAEVKVAVMTNEDGVDLIVDDKGKIYYKGKEREYKDLPENIKGYIDMNGEIPKVLHNENFVAQMKEKGFIVQKQIVPGIIDDSGIVKNQVVADVFVGSIVVPASFNPSKQKQYDRESGLGEKGQRAGYAQGAYDLNMDMDQWHDIGGRAGELASPEINKSSKDYLTVKTGRDVGNLNWKPSKVLGNGMDTWIAEDDEYVYQYNHRDMTAKAIKK